MSGYYYQQMKPGLWTVGRDDYDGAFVPDSDWNSREEARKQVALLNGAGQEPQTPPGIGSREWYAGLAMQGVINRFAFNSCGRMDEIAVAKSAFAIADAMLSEANKENRQ